MGLVVKDSALSLLWLRLYPWLKDFCMPWAWQEKKSKESPSCVIIIGIKRASDHHNSRHMVDTWKCPFPPHTKLAILKRSHSRCCGYFHHTPFATHFTAHGATSTASTCNVWTEGFVWPQTLLCCPCKINVPCEKSLNLILV